MNMKPIMMIFVVLLLTFSVSAQLKHELEVTNIEATGGISAGKEATFIVQVVNNGDINFPSNSHETYEITVYYGDGTTDIYTTSSEIFANKETYIKFKHTYSRHGVYIVNVQLESSNDDFVYKNQITKSFSVSATDRTEDVDDYEPVNTSVPDALKIVESELYFGGPSQTRNKDLLETFTIKNIGTETISSLQLTALDNNLDLIDGKYNAVFSALEKYTLNSGESMGLSLTFTVPADKDSGKEQIGFIKVIGKTSSENLEYIVPVFMEAKSYLKIDEVELEVDDDTEKISNNENFDELKEDDEVTIRVTVENTYLDSSNLEIEDVYVKMTSSENDWDIDEESDEEDINEDDSYTFEMTFTIEDLKSERTDVVLEVIGKDKENSFTHYDTMTFSLEVDKDRNDIRIIDYNWEDSSVSCDDDYAELEVEFENKGTDDQEEVAIRVESDDLDFDKEYDDIELDAGDDDSQIFKIYLPNNIDEGEYELEITTYYDDDKKSDSETITLDVVCPGSSSSSSYSSSSNTNSNQNDDNDLIVSQSSSTPETVTVTGVQSESNDNSDVYMILLIVFIIIIVVVIGGTIYVMVKSD